MITFCKVCGEFKKCVGTRLDGNKPKVWICDSCRLKLFEKWLKER